MGSNENNNGSQTSGTYFRGAGLDNSGDGEKVKVKNVSMGDIEVLKQIELLAAEQLSAKIKEHNLPEHKNLTAKSEDIDREEALTVADAVAQVKNAKVAGNFTLADNNPVKIDAPLNTPAVKQEVSRRLSSEGIELPEKDGIKLV